MCTYRQINAEETVFELYQAAIGKIELAECAQQKLSQRQRCRWATIEVAFFGATRLALFSRKCIDNIVCQTTISFSNGTVRLDAEQAFFKATIRVTMALLWLLFPLLAFHAATANKRPMLQHLIGHGIDDERSEVFAQGIGEEHERSLSLVGRKSGGGATLGGPCSSSDECAGVSDSSCEAGSCQCDVGFVPLSNVACVPQARYFGDMCAITGQCRHLNSNAMCYKDRCLCEPHFYVAAKDCNAPKVGSYSSSGGSVFTGSGSFHGLEPSAPAVTCHRKRPIGGECCSTKQCSYEVWNSKCQDEVCVCKDGYVPIGSYTCAKKATALGGECAVDAQCQDMPDSECKADGFCWCNSATTPSEPVTGPTGRQASPSCLPLVNLGDGCTTNSQCTRLTRNSRCWSPDCTCLPGFVEQPGANECLPEVNNVDMDFCTTTRQCTVDNTICSPDTAKCACRHDHCLVLMEPNGERVCLEKVGDGGDCTNACQCRFEGSSCDEGKCACHELYHADPATGKCERYTLEFTSRQYVFAGQFCCAPDPTAGIFVGQPGVSTQSTFPPLLPIFTIEINVFVYVDENGVIRVKPNTNIHFNMAIACDVVSSQTVPDINGTTLVELRPDPCCGAEVKLLSPSVTVAIVDISPSTPNAGCNAFGSTDEAANANDIIDFDDQTYNEGNGMTRTLRLFEHPCHPGTDTIVTISDFVRTRGMLCTAQPGANTIDWAGTTTQAIAGTACTVEGMVTGCNGIASAFSIIVDIPAAVNC